MSRIKAGVYGRISRGSNHASTSTSSVHAVQCILPRRYLHVYFAESGFYSNHAAVSRRAWKNRLLFESCFYTSHAFIRDTTVWVQENISSYAILTARYGEG